MVIDGQILSGVISNNILSLEYEVQQMLEHQILVEAGAAQTQAQKKGLEALYKSARAYLSCDGSKVSVSLTFLSIPEGMENYAEMIKGNAITVVQPYLGERLKDILSLDDAQNAIRDEIKQWAVNQLRGFLGGV